MPDALKVVIYVTSERGLLVFDEPDFPAVSLQVPGGTIEPGERAEDAARRELREETGLVATSLRPLATHDYTFARDGFRICHRRHYFHTTIEETPAEWIHFERTPASGGAAIRFRLHWLPIDVARECLGYGFEAMLDRI